MQRSTIQRWLARLCLIAGFGLAAGFAVAYLRAQYCQFTWLTMGLHDYGIYTNVLWNSAHGELFRYVVDENYLATHLSFSLLLLAPLFHLSEHPFLLTVVQWCCALGGGAWVVALARRIGCNWPLTAALVFLFLGYPFTQMSLLCEFHGVHLYYVLLPWLYACAVFRRGWVWLPLLLIAGLREEAIFLVIPMLLYLARTQRWRAGYAYAAAGAAYGLLAIVALYPAINGFPIWERRADVVAPELVKNSLTALGLRRRLFTVLRLLLPALPFLRRDWAPIAIIPSLALVIPLCSAVSHHYRLDRHYSASVFTLLVLALLEALRRDHARHPARANTPRLALAAFFILATLIAHRVYGTAPWWRPNPRPVYLRTSDEGRAVLRALPHLPPDGILLTDEYRAGMCANRRDLVTFRTVAVKPHMPDVIFVPLDMFTSYRAGMIATLINVDHLGVTWFDRHNVILQRGADTNRLGDVLALANELTRTVAFAASGAASARLTREGDGDSIRVWRGRVGDARRQLIGGKSIQLGPGEWTARFWLRGEAPADPQAPWGRLDVAVNGIALAESAILPQTAPPGSFCTQDVRVTLTATNWVEPRVFGGPASLWMDRVVFIPAN
ncbi:MAG: DUF2079 domain-containing protein [Lentisphaerae bacterium]|nr:DUF2079 domain-containing protein [Lentisphaerota bacterium]